VSESILENDIEVPSIYSFTLPELREYLGNHGLTKFGADQIFNWAYKKFNLNVDEWMNISSKTRDHIKTKMKTTLPEVVWTAKSVDGTRKFLLKMEDGHTVEAVAIPAKDRLTLCVSSQVGCAIGCAFCHTGTMGFVRHLKVEEVVGEYMTIQQWLEHNDDAGARFTNMVYMGQGEPLHNFDNMKKATEIFMDPKGLNYGQRKITLSTSGLIPQIEKLVDFPSVNIAISLHAAHDDIRTELMPINKVYDLHRLLEAIRKIPLKAYRRITYEYLLIDGMNDRIQDIEALTKLLDKKKSKINLIPFNDYPDSRFKCPPEDRIMWFMDQLLKRGFQCTLRVSKGQDILAACGQLKSTYENGKKNLWESEEK